MLIYLYQSQGVAQPSLTQDLLTMDVDGMANYEHRVKWTTGALYGAGAETVSFSQFVFPTLLVFLIPSLDIFNCADIYDADGPPP